jgi:hypothetical protein
MGRGVDCRETAAASFINSYSNTHSTLVPDRGRLTRTVFVFPLAAVTTRSLPGTREL